MKATLLPLILASFLTAGMVGASPAQSASSRTIKAKYKCSKGQSLTVLFKGSKATVTPKGGKSITLSQAKTADGFLYTKSKYKLRGRGDDATWTVGSHKPLKCYART